MKHIRKDFIYRTALLVALGFTISVVPLVADDQLPPDRKPGAGENRTQVRPNDQERYSTPVSSLERDGELTSERFVQAAAEGGKREVRLSQVALARSQDSAVKEFAQRMVTDHTQANQELLDIARAKGIDLKPERERAVRGKPYHEDRDQLSTTVPNADARIPDIATQTPSSRSGQTSTEPQLRNREPLSTAAPNADAKIPDIANPTLSSGVDKERQLSNLNSSRNGERRDDLVLSDRELEALPTTEFDQAYLRAMVKDHSKAVRLFERASQLLSDQDLKNFASKTLPSLREHENRVRELARSKGITEELQALR